MANYRITTGLPQLPPSAYKDEEFAKFLPVYQALNALARNLSTAVGQVDYDQQELSDRNQLGSLLSGNFHQVYPKAALDLDYGMLVNLYVDGGKIWARQADAGSGREAHGIVNEPYGITSGAFGQVLFMEGHCYGVSGTVFGESYYLGGSGLMTTPAPGSGLIQPVAFGLGSLGVYLRIQHPA